MKLYNTLTRAIEKFTPLDPARKRVGIYVCGPTVYDDPHIGHARSAYVFDVLRRWLREKQYQVTFVRNVTDVDDKIINKAREELGTGRHPAAGGTPVADPPAAGAPARSETGDLKKKCREVAERYLTSYHVTLDRLGILPPDVEPKATEHVIPDSNNVAATKKIDASMTGFISQLITKNVAYPAGGDVYFSVRKFPGYGKLSNRSLDALQAGARVEPGEHKEDPLDFALWKAAKPDEPSWNSPWGPGRPGWHIECSVMSTAYLGDAFDIHGGGLDLVFPHHENEIAQAQALGKPFAKYWVHNGLLTVNGEKMSKSLGNFITVERSLQECGRNSNILKVFFLGTHYRSPINYSTNNLKAAAGRWNRWYYFLVPAEREKQRSFISASDAIPQELSRFLKGFERAMDDDLNTPEALAVLDELVGYGYQCWRELESSQGTDNSFFAQASKKVIAVADTFHQLRQVLGLSWRELRPLTEEERNLAAQYEVARKGKQFTRSDTLRKQLEEMGLLMQDTPIGSIAIPKQGDF